MQSLELTRTHPGPAAAVHASDRSHAPGRREGIAAFGLAAVGVIGLGAAGGGYFAGSWGWVVLACSLVTIWAIGLGGVTRPTGAELAFLGGLAGLAGWSALSAVWGVPSVAVQSAFRVLLYAAAVAAALAVARRGSASAVLAGATAGGTAVAAYALATRLFPERIGSFDSLAGYRLATPIGYWNGLGLLCAVTILVALGLAASSRSVVGAALAAAPVPALAAALYFTFSRGSWLSLGIGLVVAFALCPRRVRLTAFTFAAGIPAAVGVVLASRSHALTHEGAVVVRAAHDGHRLAVALLALTLAAAGLGAIAAYAGARVGVGPLASRVFSGVLGFVALAAVAAVLAHLGGPVGGARTAWSAFAAAPPQTGSDLTQRLFSFSGDNRVPLWHVAWDDARSHLATGSGAGTYEAQWLARRTEPSQVKNAHSLYLETLAELGIVGLVLLLVALAAPVVAGIRARRRPAVAAATGAYVAYLAGATVDWDWQLTAVTLVALLVGAGILAAARPAEQRPLSAWMRRGAMAFAVAAGAAGFVFLVGNLFLSRAGDAAAAGRWGAAAADAQRASGWLPWSTAPLAQLGEAQLGERNLAAAQASFRAAIRKDPGDWNLWFDLARASTGATQAAALAQAKRLNPLGPEIAAFESELGSRGGISLAVAP